MSLYERSEYIDDCAVESSKREDQIVVLIDNLELLGKHNLVYNLIFPRFHVA